MQKDKVIIVSGEPRSGTSLMMQTMILLGLPIAGEKYPQTKKINLGLLKIKDPKERELAQKEYERQMKHAEKMNPRGFYEIPGMVMMGLSSLEYDDENEDESLREKGTYAGKVIKIVTHGVYERKINGRIIGTPSRFIDKIIMCTRDPKFTAVSQTDLTGNIEVAGDDGWENFGQPISPKRYIHDVGNFIMWIPENKFILDKIMIVDYQDMHEKKPIEEIVSFLDINPTKEQIESAKNNIDPLLKRSTNFKGWEDEDEIEGDLAIEIYNALKEKDVKKMESLKGSILETFNHWKLEATSWVDTERKTWVTMGPEVYRENKTRPINNKLRPDKSCPFYSLAKEKYTIERPIDIGDLIRPMVCCLRDSNNKTNEECKFCWQRGTYRNGIAIPGQRVRGKML